MSVFFIAGSSYYPSEVEELGNSFVEMDATVSLNEEFNNSISSHPVQVGADITDHVRRENNKFSIKGMISDYSPGQRVKQGSFYTSAGTGDGSVIPSRAQQAYEFITRMRNNAVLFTLVTQYKSYPNCVISKVSNEHKAANGGALELSIDVQQIRIVRTSSTILASTVKEPDDSVSVKNNGTESGGEIESNFIDDVIRANIEYPVTLWKGLMAIREGRENARANRQGGS